MSLDVYLIQKGAVVANKTSSGIFIRDGGSTREISVEEWEARYPGREPATFIPDETESDEVFSANITHNLGNMAQQAGIYEALWRPEEIDITTARQLIEPLRQGLHLLKSDPEHYKDFNPENGWGDYEGLINFVQNYLDACYQFPDAEIRVSR